MVIPVAIKGQLVALVDLDELERACKIVGAPTGKFPWSERVWARTLLLNSADPIRTLIATYRSRLWEASRD